MARTKPKICCEGYHKCEGEEYDILEVGCRECVLEGLAALAKEQKASSCSHSRLNKSAS